MTDRLPYETAQERLRRTAKNTYLVYEVHPTRYVRMAHLYVLHSDGKGCHYWEEDSPAGTSRAFASAQRYEDSIGASR